MQNDTDSLREQLQITCADATEILTDFLDQTLSAGDQRRLRAHLNGCQACAVYLDQLKLTVRVTGTIAGDDDYTVDEETMSALLAIHRGALTDNSDGAEP